MSNYYLHINTDRLSIELDSDVKYHHYFSKGDILTINFTNDINSTSVDIKELNNKKFGNYNAIFTLDWNSKSSARLSIMQCISMGHMTDITKSIERNKKIEELGI
jgi:hypothetical protein